MRSLACGVLLAIVGISIASAEQPPFHAGMTRTAVQDATPFDTLIVYPTDTPEVSVEEGLVRIIPEKYMRHAHHWLILHGRYVCKARRPECERCVIADICKAAEKTSSIAAPLVELAPEAVSEAAQ